MQIKLLILMMVNFVLLKDQVLFSTKKKKNKKILELSSDQAKYDKGDFQHFMARN